MKVYDGVSLTIRSTTEKAFLVSFAILFSLFIAAPVLAQSLPARLSITGVDSTSYPEVRVFSQLRGVEPGSLHLIPAGGGMVLYEDGDAKEILEAGLVDVGVKLVFLIDNGDGLLNTGIPLDQVCRAGVGTLRAFASGTEWMRPGMDEVELLIQHGGRTEVAVPAVTGTAELLESLDDIKPPEGSLLNVPESGIYTEAGLIYALDEIGTDAVKQGDVVLFTPGFYRPLDRVVQKALENDVRIHVVLVRHSKSYYWAEYGRELADRTGGQFLELYHEPDIGPFLEGLRSNAHQMMLTYKSTSPGLHHQVQFQMEYEGFNLQSVMHYSAEPLPPEVILHEPIHKAVNNLSDAAGPVQEAGEGYFLRAEVAFPGSSAGRSAVAELLVDNILVDRKEVSGGEVLFHMDPDVFPADSSGVDIRVVVTDELGLQNEAVLLSYGMDAEPGTDAAGGYIWIILAAAFLIIVSSAVYLLYRKTHGGAVPPDPGTMSSEMVEGVTGCQCNSEVRAYLIPLEGIYKRQSSPFKLYGTSALGRSRKAADILIHRDDDSSPVSRLHLTILDQDDHFAVRDENSSNGTYLNEEPLIASQVVRLHDGDILDLGQLERGGVRLLFKHTLEQPGLTGEDDTDRRTRPAYAFPVVGPETVEGQGLDRGRGADDFSG